MVMLQCNMTTGKCQRSDAALQHALPSAGSYPEVRVALCNDF
jgi:hypothetical protein